MKKKCKRKETKKGLWRKILINGGGLSSHIENSRWEGKIVDKRDGDGRERTQKWEKGQRSSGPENIHVESLYCSETGWFEEKTRRAGRAHRLARVKVSSFLSKKSGQHRHGRRSTKRKEQETGTDGKREVATPFNSSKKRRGPHGHWGRGTQRGSRRDSTCVEEEYSRTRRHKGPGLHDVEERGGATDLLSILPNRVT